MRLTATWLLLALTLAAAPLRADERVRDAQQELRRRKLYFGRVDGQAAPATTAAVRKFQELKGLERTGAIDGETASALGLRTSAGPDASSGGAECCALVASYLAAQERGDLDAVMRCYSERVDFFDDGPSDRAFLRELHRRELQRWPQRKVTLLQRIATEHPARAGEVLVTARIRTQISGARARAEDVTFLLRRDDGAWRITAVKLLE